MWRSRPQWQGWVGTLDGLQSLVIVQRNAAHQANMIREYTTNVGASVQVKYRVGDYSEW